GLAMPGLAHFFGPLASAAARAPWGARMRLHSKLTHMIKTRKILFIGLSRFVDSLAWWRSAWRIAADVRHDPGILQHCQYAGRPSAYAPPHLEGIECRGRGDRAVGRGRRRITCGDRFLLANLLEAIS